MDPDPNVANGPDEVRRKRLRFQCWHRGMREMDLILGAFADRELDRLSEDELDALERLLAVPDDTLYVWVSGRAAVPPQYDCSLFRRLTPDAKR